eukprot:CAMPEP_0115654212 /NCGR_PEP_ID=MMETSP0272-20121206/42997_1 /TAXON_ID=71861 /ORGANISM="Scrippsiella trochoidea, Strain CCMP3099" /LENGTH=111 /DNA_ID=CAMNT_0003092099 /DNA_START=352 /DNA_END=688 /DNA_ORIENTATION=+
MKRLPKRVKGGEEEHRIADQVGGGQFRETRSEATSRPDPLEDAGPQEALERTLVEAAEDKENAESVPSSDFLPSSTLCVKASAPLAFTELKVTAAARGRCASLALSRRREE